MCLEGLAAWRGAYGLLLALYAESAACCMQSHGTAQSTCSKNLATKQLTAIRSCFILNAVNEPGEGCGRFVCRGPTLNRHAPLTLNTCETQNRNGKPGQAAHGQVVFVLLQERVHFEKTVTFLKSAWCSERSRFLLWLCLPARLPKSA